MATLSAATARVKAVGIVIVALSIEQDSGNAAGNIAVSVWDGSVLIPYQCLCHNRQVTNF